MGIILYKNKRRVYCVPSQAIPCAGWHETKAASSLEKALATVLPPSSLTTRSALAGERRPRGRLLSEYYPPFQPSVKKFLEVRWDFSGIFSCCGVGLGPLFPCV